VLTSRWELRWLTPEDVKPLFSDRKLHRVSIVEVDHDEALVVIVVRVILCDVNDATTQNGPEQFAIPDVLRVFGHWNPPASAAAYTVRKG
jgi:hypothetical protein